MALMIADLHTHTTASDGSLPPDELIAAARANEVGLLAITDHDTLSGYRAAAQSKSSRIKLIPGIELSTRWRKITVHVLGLNVDPTSATILAAENFQQRLRMARAEDIAAQLEHLSIPRLLERSLELAGDGQIGRPHFAQVMVADRVVKDANTAFRKYLGPGKAGDVGKQWPDLARATGWIRDAGGIAVLAHPSKYRLTNTRLKELLTDFVTCGGRALEVVSGIQDPATTRKLALLCEQFEMLASCGSDYHGPHQHWQRLGCIPALPKSLTTVLQEL